MVQAYILHMLHGIFWLNDYTIHELVTVANSLGHLATQILTCCIYIYFISVNISQLIYFTKATECKLSCQLNKLYNSTQIVSHLDNKNGVKFRFRLCRKVDLVVELTDHYDATSLFRKYQLGTQFFVSNVLSALDYVQFWLL